MEICFACPSHIFHRFFSTIMRTCQGILDSSSYIYMNYIKLVGFSAKFIK